MRASRNAGLAAGVALAACAWVGLLSLHVLRTRPIPWSSVTYNVPITLVFSGLLLYIALDVLVLGPRRFLAAYAPLGVVWGLGVLVLYLRLVTRSTEISGHMSWSVVMGVQCAAQHMPAWFVASSWLVVLHIAFLKFVAWGGHSGHKGLLVGAILGMAAWLACRGRADLDYRRR
jgi:hypothetical protein